MTITKDSLLLIEDNGENLSASVEAVGDIVSPIAKHAEAPSPRAGLVLPGTGLTINPITGRLDSLVMEKSLQFRGIVGSGTKELQSPLGGEDFGDFYIVQEDNYLLNNNWGDISGETVNSGTFLIYGTNDEFQILTDVLGGDSITEITSGTPSVRVVEVSDGRLEIFVDDAVAATGGAGGEAGLLIANDKEKIDNLGTTYLSLAGGNLTGILNIKVGDGTTGHAIEIGDDTGGNPNLTILQSGGIQTKYTDFKADEYVTKDYVDVALNDMSIANGGQIKGDLILAADLGTSGSTVEQGKVYEFDVVHAPGPGIASEYIEVGAPPQPLEGDVFTATKNHTFTSATDTIVTEVISEANLSVAGHISTSGQLWAGSDAQFGKDIYANGEVYKGFGDDKKALATVEYVDANAGGDPFVGGSITEELVIEENVNIRLKGGTLIVEDDGMVDLENAAISNNSALPKKWIGGIVHLDSLNSKAAGITIRRKSNGLTSSPTIKLYGADDLVADMEMFGHDNHRDVKIKAGTSSNGPYMYLGDNVRPAKTDYEHAVMTRKAVEEITDAIIARLDAAGI